MGKNCIIQYYTAPKILDCDCLMTAFFFIKMREKKRGKYKPLPYLFASVDFNFSAYL